MVAGRRRPNARRNGPNAITTLKKQVRGNVFTPKADPRDITEHPWNTWVYARVVMLDSGATVATATGDIFTRLRLQTGITTADLQLKISACRVWCMASDIADTPSVPHAGLGVPSIETAFWDIGEATLQSQRAIQRDSGTVSVPARVGYTYPMVDSKDIFDSSETSRLVQSTLSLANTWTSMTIRISCLWRPMKPTASAAQIIALAGPDGIIAPGVLDVVSTSEQPITLSEGEISL